MTLHHLMLFVHLAGVIVWVGGMSFAHFCLRPAALQLPPPQRLALWHGVLARFFPIVWLALAAIVGSGFAMLLAVGFAQAPLAWHAMAAVGLVMAAIFASIWFGPWKALQQAVAQKIREKDASVSLVGNMVSEGTTPRHLTDLIGSLCDLTSGSGDKGTPIVYIQGYFDNYTND